VCTELESAHPSRELRAVALSPIQTVLLKKEQPRAQGYVPKFKIFKQEESNWCWAAVTQSVKKVLDGPTIKQCRIVERTRHPDRPNCCNDHDSCDEAFFTNLALDEFNNLREFIKTHLSLDGIKSEIPEGTSNNARPIGCGVSDGEKGGHAVVIFGWQEFINRVKLHVGEPKSGENVVEYLGPFSQPRGKSWVETYRTKKAGK
jgi:hypothetical protein